jgi:Nop53 (60S ribosomal biogenesis)
MDQDWTAMSNASAEGAKRRRKRRRSRKGKKEFRKNIDADALTVVSAQRRAAVRASLASAPDSDLFFIDKNAHLPTRTWEDVCVCVCVCVSE